MPVKRGLPSTLKMRHDRHYVEELSSNLGAPVGRMVAIERLEPNPGQPRVDFGEIEELVGSIREKGVLEPLLIRPSEVGGRYMIISGERRFRAALEAGLIEVPCIEMDVDECEVAEIALIENLQRKDLTPFEEADGLSVLSERFGYTHEEIAARIGKSRTTVTESLTLAALPAEVRSICLQAGIASKSLLLQIARQPDAAAMLAFVRRIAEQGLNRDDARKARSNKQSRPQPYIFKYNPPGREFRLEIKFRRNEVSNEDLISSLEAIIEDLRRSAPE